MKMLKAVKLLRKDTDIIIDKGYLRVYCYIVYISVNTIDKTIISVLCYLFFVACFACALLCMFLNVAFVLHSLAFLLYF